MYSNVVAAAAKLASETCCRVKWCQQKKMYECTRCGYASERKSNVGRHFRRIHCELKKHKICAVCEKSFSTKGEFYEHCEKEHPHLRNSCYITSEKYKIGRKQNHRRRNQARLSQKTRATSYKRAGTDETSEEETSDSTFDNGNENVKRIEEDPAESEDMEDQETYEKMEDQETYEEMEDQETYEEIEDQESYEEMEDQESYEEMKDQETYEEMKDQETYEEMEEYQGDDEGSHIEQENIEPIYDVQNQQENVKIDIIPFLHEGEMEKVIVQEISEVYASIPCPTPDNDSSSWSHKANESLTSSPIRSLRTDFLSPILWTPTSYKLPTTPSSTTDPDEPISSPARTIKTDDFIFSPARSLKNDDSSSSSASSVVSDDYLSSPAKVYKFNEFMSPTMKSPNVCLPSTSKCSSKVDLSVSFAYCNTPPSCSNAAVTVNTSSSPSTSSDAAVAVNTSSSPSISSDAAVYVSSPSRLPLKKRFVNYTQRSHLADITNIRNNEFNVKSRFNNNEMQVANRNFSAVNGHQQAFFKNIDFDDLEAVLILKSLKESNR